MDTPEARVLDHDVMDELVRTVREADPNPVVVLVLTGSPERGLAMSVWTALEGEGADEQALGMVTYAIEQA